MPALMKKWLDEVFLHGFSHGSKGVLGGKKFLVSFTTGAPAVAYTGEEGSIGDITKMMEMYKSIAALCHLDYQGAMWVNGVSYSTRQTPEGVEQQRQAATAYVEKLIAKIKEFAE